MLDDLIVLIIGGLAAARITTLIVHDSILEPIRWRVFLWSPPADNLDAGLHYQGFVRPSLLQLVRGWRPARSTDRREPGIVGRLVSCDRCVGAWVAAALAATYHAWPEPTALVAGIAAVAQLSSIAIQAAD